MRVLLTGATGLIGQELGKFLAAAGHEVVAVSRRASPADLAFPARVVKWAGSAEPFPLPALEGVDAVINLAGESVAASRWNAKIKRAIYDSRVLGTRALVTAFAQVARPPKILLQASAIGFYGDCGDREIDESDAAGEDFLAGVVREWEAEARKAEVLGVRVAMIRTGVVLAAQGGALEKLLPLFASGLGGRLGSGRQWMSWIHLADLLAIFARALSDETCAGILNATAPEPVTNSEFTGALCRALGRREFLPVPKFVLRAVLGEASSAILASARVLPRRLLANGFSFRYPRLAPALAELAATAGEGNREFIAEQWVSEPPGKVFPFFSDEKNLEALTPPFLNFRVLGKSTPTMADGTLIDYRLSVHGVPMRWRSRIESWQPSSSFVDRQVKGPYGRWLHVHEFLPLAGGTLIKDHVRYRLPLGPLGDWLAAWKVTRDVGEIFRYRRQKIAEIFPQRSEK